MFFYFSQAFNYNPPRITFVVILDFGFYWLALLWLFASNRMCFRGRRGSCLLRYPKWFILHWGTWRNSVVCRARLAPNWDGLKSMDSPSSLAFAEGSWGASLWCMLRCTAFASPSYLLFLYCTISYQRVKAINHKTNTFTYWNFNFNGKKCVCLKLPACAVPSGATGLMSYLNWKCGPVLILARLEATLQKVLVEAAYRGTGAIYK